MNHGKYWLRVYFLSFSFCRLNKKVIIWALLYDPYYMYKGPIIWSYQMSIWYEPYDMIYMIWSIYYCRFDMVDIISTICYEKCTGISIKTRLLQIQPRSRWYWRIFHTHPYRTFGTLWWFWKFWCIRKLLCMWNTDARSGSTTGYVIEIKDMKTRSRT